MLDEFLANLIKGHRQEQALKKLEELEARASGRMPRAGSAPETPRLNFDPAGGVRDAGGWFSAPAPANWVHDSENLFRSDIANLGAPRMGAPVPVRPPLLSAADATPGPLAAPPVVGAAEAAPGGAPPMPGPGSSTRYQVEYYHLLKDALGDDPVKLQEFLRQQQMNDLLREASPQIGPYGRANIGAGKTAALPYAMDSYGKINQETGASEDSAYARAQTELAAERARTSQAQAGSFDARAARSEAGAVKDKMAWVLKEGTTVEELKHVEFDDNGRMRTLPALDENERPVTRAAKPDKPAAPVSPYTKPQSPQEFWNDRYQAYTLPVEKRGPELAPEKATALANADMFQAFPAIKRQAEELAATAAKLLATRPDKKAEIEKWLTDGLASLKATGQLPP